MILTKRNYFLVNLINPKRKQTIKTDFVLLVNLQLVTKP